MLFKLLSLLIISITGKQEPVYSLYPSQKRRKLNVNWTFIAVVIGLTLFFAVLLISMLMGTAGVESGNYYNHL